MRLVKFFSNLNYHFIGYFDPVNLFLIIKINDFWVNLSDISARTETLVPRVPTVFAIALKFLDACERIKS